MRRLQVNMRSALPTTSKGMAAKKPTSTQLAKARARALGQRTEDDATGAMENATLRDIAAPKWIRMEK